jgi:DHA3 family tetracycline resistance protein-like MFS transporter
VRADGAGHEPLLRQVREAAAFVKQETWLWATLIMAALALLVFYGPTEVLLPLRVNHDLGGDAGAFGLVLAAEGIASVIGTVAIGHFGMPRREITVLYWVWTLAGFALIGYALVDTVWQMALCTFIFGLFGGAGNPIWATLIQVRVPPGLRGRVASLDWLVSVGLTPVSFALTGPLAAAFGAQAVLLVAGLQDEDGGIARAQAAGASAGPQPPSSDPRSFANVG